MRSRGKEVEAQSHPCPPAQSSHKSPIAAHQYTPTPPPPSLDPNLRPSSWGLVISCRVAGRQGGSPTLERVANTFHGTLSSWLELISNRDNVLVQTPRTMFCWSGNVRATARKGVWHYASWAVVAWKGSALTRATNREVISNECQGGTFALRAGAEVPLGASVGAEACV